MLGTLDAAALVDVGTLIARLKADVFRGRVRLKEFFKDFDPLRAGVVTEAKFRTAITKSGLTLNDPELRTLATHFADPTDPKKERVLKHIFDTDLFKQDTIGLKTLANASLMPLRMTARAYNDDDDT